MKWRVVLFLLALSGLCAIFAGGRPSCGPAPVFSFSIALSKDGIKVAWDIADHAAAGHRHVEAGRF